MATDPHAWNDRTAIEALSAYRDDDALSLIRQLARSPHAETRGFAIYTLGRMNDRNAVPLFVEALTDNDTWKHCKRRLLGYCTYAERICATADEALRRSTGKSVGFEPDAPLAEQRAAASKWRSVLADQL